MAVTNPPIGGPAAPASPFVPQRHGSRLGPVAALVAVIVVVSIVAYALFVRGGDPSSTTNNSSAAVSQPAAVNTPSAAAPIIINGSTATPGLDARGDEPNPFITMDDIKPYTLDGKLNPQTITVHPDSFMQTWFMLLKGAFLECNTSYLATLMDPNDALYANTAPNVRSCGSFDPVITNVSIGGAMTPGTVSVNVDYTDGGVPQSRRFHFSPSGGQWKADSKF